MAESGPGKIRLFDDFCGPEIPVANVVAYGTTAGGCHSFVGDFALKGDIADDDAGAVALDVVNGAVRLTATNEENEGMCLTTDTVFSPVLMGPIVVEARVNMQAVTARNIYVGLCDIIIDLIDPPVQSVTVTHTLTASDLAGFHIDTSLTAGTTWHCVYNGGTTTGATASTSTTSGVVAVAGEYDVLRLVVDTNGTVEWFINGDSKQKVENAVSTSVLQGVICGTFGTATTISDIDVDYLLVTANRDWTR